MLLPIVYIFGFHILRNIIESLKILCIRLQNVFLYIQYIHTLHIYLQPTCMRLIKLSFIFVSSYTKLNYLLLTNFVDSLLIIFAIKLHTLYRWI